LATAVCARPPALVLSWAGKLWAVKSETAEAKIGKK
jgi:hypothetical protein